MNRNNQSIRALSFLLLACAASPSCKKFVETDAPKTQLVTSTVFSDEATATSAVMGIFGSMSRASSFFLSFYPGLSADEFTSYSSNGEDQQFLNNSLIASNNIINISFWSFAYNQIYQSNAVIEGLSKVANIDTSVANRLMGEALFLRAYWHFYLCNLFGSVPLIEHTDYKLNQVATQQSQEVVLQKVASDLQAAQALLPEDYADGKNQVTAERYRPNKYAALALLARTYLYLGEWTQAESAASSVISQTQRYALEPNINEVFLSSSPEAVWQLMPVNTTYDTPEGNAFILTGRPSVAALRPSFVESFESNDLRKDAWIHSIAVDADVFYYPFKYKIKTKPAGDPYTEYSMPLRLAEQFLIRSEARAMQGNIEGAQEDLNIIRSRAGLSATSATDEATLVTAIINERKHEMFTEYGHRWLDLKRRALADSVLSPIKSNWQTTDTLYPIPQAELYADPKLVQNKGY